MAKVPPPVPTKPKQINLPYFGQAGQLPSPDVKPEGNIQKLPLTIAAAGNKQKPPTQLTPPASQQAQQKICVSPSGLPANPDLTLLKQESPPAAAVRPFTPQPAKEAPPPPFRKPQTVATSSIYSMYTKQQTPGKNFQQAVQSALTRAQTRGPHFPSGEHLVSLCFSRACPALQRKLRFSKGVLGGGGNRVRSQCEP